MEVYLSLNPLAGARRGWQKLQKLGCIMVSVDFLSLLQEIRYFPAGGCTGRELIFILPVPSRAPDCHSFVLTQPSSLAEHLPVLFIEETAPLLIFGKAVPPLLFCNLKKPLNTALCLPIMSFALH